MVNYFHTRPGAPRRRAFEHPIANALVILAGALAIGTFIIVGFVAFLLLAVIVLVLAGAFGLKAWWHGRRSGRRRARAGGERVGTTVIEGDFEDVTGPRRLDPDDA
ncbi:MAG: hypothetical protein R3315_02285 [Woeseiaceae bacterium]|nr:hypothetical protein [Woeseiaceae bacterium]